jgi:hypothetical protein
MAKILCPAKLPFCTGVTNEVEGWVLVDIGPKPDSLVVNLRLPLFVCEDCAEWVKNSGGSAIRYTRGLRVQVEVLPSGSTVPQQVELAALLCDRVLAEAHLDWATVQVRGLLWGAGRRNSNLDPQVDEMLAPARTAFAEGDFSLVVELAGEAVAKARELWQQSGVMPPPKV